MAEQSIIIKEVIETVGKLREDLSGLLINNQKSGVESGIELIGKMCSKLLKSEDLNQLLRDTFKICDKKYSTLFSLWDFIEEKWFKFHDKEFPHHIYPEDENINKIFNEIAKKLVHKELTLNNRLKRLYDNTNRKIYGFIKYEDEFNDNSINEKYVSNGMCCEGNIYKGITNCDKCELYYEETRKYVKEHFLKPSPPYGFLFLFTALKGTSKKTTGFGGIFSIYTDKEISRESVLYLDVLTEMIFDLFTNIFYQEQNKRIKRYSIQSAIAAIMSRNVSHNIGSHILSTLGYEGISVADDRILFRYLQQRMDYIALISTETTKWTNSAWFLNDIMKWFYKQKNLLDYIARSEGLKSHYWKNNIEESAKEKTIVIKIKNSTKGKEKYIIPPGTGDENPLKDDFQVAVPGGIAGLHAFYTILENIIRNSAKHDWSKKKAENLEITINFNNDPEKNYVLFTISDNISDIYNTPKFIRPLLDTRMNKIFTEDIIDKAGELQKQNWGLGEMRISAGYLNKKESIDIGLGGQNILLKEIKDNKTDGFIKATSIYDNSHKAYRLGYQFIIPKPKEVLIIGNWIYDIGIKIYEEEAKKAGVYFIEKPDNERDYNFVLLHEDVIETLLKKVKADKGSIFSELDLYTARILVVTSNKRAADKKLEKRIMYIDSDIISNVLKRDGAEKWETLTLLLYRAWVHNICRYKATDELKVYIRLQGDTDSESEELQKRTQKYFNINKALQIAKQIYDLINAIIIDDSIKNIFWKFIESQITQTGDKIILEKKQIKLPSDECILSHVKKEFLNVHKEKKNVDLNSKFEKNICGIRNVKNKFSNLFRLALKTYEDIFSDLIIGNESKIETLPETLMEKDEKNNVKEIFNNLSSGTDDYLKKVKDGDAENFNIIYRRHGNALYENALYSESLSGSQTYFTILSTHLSSTNSSILRQKMGLELIENALLRMVIIDERIMRFCKKNKNVMERYRWMNIDIFEAVCWKKYAGISYLSTKEKLNKLEKKIQARDISEIEFFYHKNENDFKGKTLKDFNNDRNRGLDILIIHQGILDKMKFESSDTSKDNSEKFIEELKEEIPFVFVTSGRGKPANLPKNVKFLPFSAIETFLMKEYPEKFLLTQSLMQIFMEEVL